MIGGSPSVVSASPSRIMLTWRGVRPRSRSGRMSAVMFSGKAPRVLRVLREGHQGGAGGDRVGAAEDGRPGVGDVLGSGAVAAAERGAVALHRRGDAARAVAQRRAEAVEEAVVHAVLVKQPERARV